MTEPHKPRGLLIFLSLATLIGLVALILSIQNAFDVSRADRQRERDRISADQRACERGNDLRRQIVTIAVAQELLVEGILEEIFAEVDSPDVVSALRTDLAPLFDAYEVALEAVEITDCAAAVPGA